MSAVPVDCRNWTVCGSEPQSRLFAAPEEESVVLPARANCQVPSPKSRSSPSPMQRYPARIAEKNETIVKLYFKTRDAADESASRARDEGLGAEVENRRDGDP